jgi:bisphosphoglycerate-dependent phosphoglycerate mutase
MTGLALLRHGESIWNRENCFTGWTGVDLSEKGIEEAKRAGQVLREVGPVFHPAFCLCAEMGYQEEIAKAMEKVANKSN